MFRPILRSLLALAALSPAAFGQYTRLITFSGYTFLVKTSSGKVGPGPNYFSDSTDNVWVDGSGLLHMKITRQGNRWNCAEIILTNSFGNGTYRFYLNSPVDSLDPNVVLGLFTWDDDPAYNHREIDVEFSRWSQKKNLNAQYVVQPYTDPRNILRWNEPPSLPQSVHTFQWTASSVNFASFAGNSPYVTPFLQTSMTNGIPVPGGENARINLWLDQGRAPTNRQSVEVVFSKFEFSLQ